MQLAGCLLVAKRSTRQTYAFQVALPLVKDELLAFSAIEIAELEALGLEVVDLTAAQVGRALALRSSRPTLSAHDCFTISLAESQPGAMILTGDQALRTQSQALNIEVHGVLWVGDQLEHHKTCSAADLSTSMTRSIFCALILSLLFRT